MNEQDRNNLFSELLTGHQSQLYSYIFAFVRKREEAEDLFQSVCVVLWQRFDSFRPGSNFFAWARQTAIYVLRNALRRRKPPGYLSDELLDALAEADLDSRLDATDTYLLALRHCREELDDADAHLLELRYVDDLNTRQIADQLGRPQQGICNSLMRIRRWLFDCVRMEIARREHSA
jgi:RNA polymerase sigma-70 factor, ECF subfamily